MAAWPDLAALKATLDVGTTDFDDILEGCLASAIALVKIDVGDDIDEPDERLSEAARLLAVRIAKAPSSADSTARMEDHQYQRLLKGHRVRFGVA